jgi:restriction system protein
MNTLYKYNSFPFFIGLAFKPFRSFLWNSLRPFIVDVFITLIKSIKYKSPIPTDLYDIDRMDGLEFEKVLKPLFERQGYLAEVTQGSGDYGADLILRKGTKKYVVQAKRYSSNIGVSAVQQVVGAIKYYKASGAIVVTNQYFTQAAVNLAKSNRVKLIDREELAKMIR